MYAQTQTLGWDMRLFGALRVDATLAKSSWGGHGSLVSIEMCSRDMRPTMSVWQNYEGKNNWNIFPLEPVMDDDEKGARDSICCMLNPLEVGMSLMIHEGEVGAIGTTDKAAMGYYILKWLSKPYSLQADAEGMSGMITAGAMVVDGLYFNRVQRAPYWYTRSGETTIVEVRHVLRSGLQLDKISATNKLPQVCNRLEARRKKAVKIAAVDHEVIMEEAGRRDRL